MVHDIFVGRENLIATSVNFLSQLDSAKEENLTRVMTIQGIGGIGKTKLLEQINKVLSGDLGFVTTPVIDLKATSNRSPILLTETLAHLLESRSAQIKSQRGFATFFQALNEYHIKKAQEKHDLYDSVIEEFFKCISQASSQAPILIFLDTFESIPLKLKEWILGVVPKFGGRVGVLLAGRENIPVKGVQVVSIDVEGFTSKEIELLAKELFEARAGLSLYDYDLTPDVISALGYKTEGRPILATLAIEWLLEDVQLEEIISIEKKDFERKIVSFLTRLDKDDYRERIAIIMMATAEKRFTPYIMSLLTKWDSEECQVVCEKLARFSFIKSIESAESSLNNRMLTLHDEMLRLVNTYFDHPPKVKNKWRQDLVERYYRPKLADSMSPQMCNTLKAEKLHYELRYAPVSAIQYFDEEMQVAIEGFEFDFCELLLSEATAPILPLDNRAKSIVELNRAEMLVKRYKPFEAKSIFDDILLSFDAEKDTEYVSRVTGGLGACIANGATIIEANLMEAIELWKSSLGICEEKGLDEQLARIYYQLGYCYDLLGQHGDALQYYGLSNLKARQLGNNRLVTKTLDDMGRLRRKRYEVEDALDLFKESLNIKSHLDDQKSMATSYHYLGDAYRDLDDFEKALEWYALAERAMLNVGDNYGLCVLYGDIGWLYLLDKQYDKCLEYTDKSYYDFAIKYHFGREMAEMEHSYYHISLDTKGIQEALPWIERAFKNAEKYSNTFIYLDAALHLIEAAYEKKQYQRILYYYEKMDELDKKGCGYRMFKGRATNILGDLAYQSNDVQKALAFWNEGYTIIGIHGRSRSSVMNFSDYLRARFNQIQDALQKCDEQQLMELKANWKSTILDKGKPQTLGLEYPGFTALLELAEGDRAYNTNQHREALAKWYSGLNRMALHIVLKNADATSIDDLVQSRRHQISLARAKLTSSTGPITLAEIAEDLDDQDRWPLTLKGTHMLLALSNHIADAFKER